MPGTQPPNSRYHPTMGLSVHSKHESFWRNLRPLHRARSSASALRGMSSPLTRTRQGKFVFDPSEVAQDPTRL